MNKKDAENPAGRIVVTVQGVDKVGIVSRVTGVLADAHANLIDISQTVLRGDLFAMVAVADLSTDSPPFDTIRTRLAALGEEIGVEIRVQREDIFRAMHRV